MGGAEVHLELEAEDVSASTLSRIKQVWVQDYCRWNERHRDRDRWVYLWVDGVYSVLISEQSNLCALAIIGVNERGEKHFLAIDDGAFKTRLRIFEETVVNAIANPNIYPQAS